MLLKDKAAVLFGAGGAIGGAPSRAVAREGARVHPSGRTLGNVDAVKAEVTEVDAQSEVGVLDTPMPS